MIWLHLTDVLSGDAIHVNAELIAAMQAFEGQTTLFMAAPGPDGYQRFSVVQTPEQIRELILEAEEELE
jgi:hypothetical protein